MRSIVHSLCGLLFAINASALVPVDLSELPDGVERVDIYLLALPQREPYTACVDACDLTGHIGDRVHYNTASQVIVGQRYADANGDRTSNTILLWPRDAASQDTKSMGTPKPDRGDGHVRLTDVTTPSLRYFPALVKEGQKPVPAVILCPGGGYVSLVTTKMTPIAEWLNDHGISAFILIYRVPKKRKDAFQDIQRAVRIVRSRASEWNIDPKRIGVMGSSAGGHLAARVSTGFDIETYQEVDKLDDVSCKPDFTVLLYPAYMNKGKALSKEFTVSNEISPTLIVSAKDDKGFFPGSPIYANALKEAGPSIRVHFFEKGGHGFSLLPKTYPLSTWPDLCLQWFRDKDIIEE